MTQHVEVVHPFAIVPEALIYDPDLSATAVRVYAVLARHGSDPANCYPGHARIADLIGASKRSVPAWVTELERAGWVERVPRFKPDGSPDSNGYRVHTVRAHERTDYAQERGPVRAGERGPSAPPRAPKESKGTRAKRNETGAAAPADAQPSLLPDAPEVAREGAANEEADLGTRARAVVTRVWERKAPKPATPFIAAVKIGERLIEAGHTQRAVYEAMMAAPTLTVAAVELQLNKGKTTAPPANERQRVMTDRSAPGGRWRPGGQR